VLGRGQRAHVVRHVLAALSRLPRASHRHGALDNGTPDERFFALRRRLIRSNSLWPTSIAAPHVTPRSAAPSFADAPTSPPSPAVIVFSKPLTLIVGTNGCGKTTIIECLKQACTGSLPPDCRAGQAFVHDPRIAGETETMAQIKLRITTKAGHAAVIVRCFSLKTATSARGPSAQFKTLDSSVLMKDAKTGKAETIGYRCAEMDRLVPELLGVSKAILENVVFVHQEDSCWPLGEPKDVKRRFDEIFGSNQYTKALEALGKLRREQATALRIKKAEMSGLEARKVEAERAAKEADERTKEAGELEARVARAEEGRARAAARLAETEGRSAEASRRRQEVAEIDARRGMLSGELAGARGRLAAAREAAGAVEVGGGDDPGDAGEGVASAAAALAQAATDMERASATELERMGAEDPAAAEAELRATRDGAARDEADARRREGEARALLSEMEGRRTQLEAEQVAADSARRERDAVLRVELARVEGRPPMTQVAETQAAGARAASGGAAGTSRPALTAEEVVQGEARLERAAREGADAVEAARRAAAAEDDRLGAEIDGLAGEAARLAEAERSAARRRDAVARRAAELRAKAAGFGSALGLGGSLGSGDDHGAPLEAVRARLVDLEARLGAARAARDGDEGRRLVERGEDLQGRLLAFAPRIKRLTDARDAAQRLSASAHRLRAVQETRASAGRQVDALVAGSRQTIEVSLGLAVEGDLGDTRALPGRLDDAATRAEREASAASDRRAEHERLADRAREAARAAEDEGKRRRHEASELRNALALALTRWRARAAAEGVPDGLQADVAAAAALGEADDAREVSQTPRGSGRSGDAAAAEEEGGSVPGSPGRDRVPCTPGASAAGAGSSPAGGGAVDPPPVGLAALPVAFLAAAVDAAIPTADAHITRLRLECEGGKNEDVRLLEADITAAELVAEEWKRKAEKGLKKRKCKMCNRDFSQNAEEFKRQKTEVQKCTDEVVERYAKTAEACRAEIKERDGAAGGPGAAKGQVERLSEALTALRAAHAIVPRLLALEGPAEAPESVGRALAQADAARRHAETAGATARAHTTRADKLRATAEAARAAVTSVGAKLRVMIEELERHDADVRQAEAAAGAVRAQAGFGSSGVDAMEEAQENLARAERERADLEREWGEVKSDRERLAAAVRDAEERCRATQDEARRAEDREREGAEATKGAQAAEAEAETEGRAAAEAATERATIEGRRAAIVERRTAERGRHQAIVANAEAAARRAREAIVELRQAAKAMTRWEQAGGREQLAELEQSCRAAQAEAEVARRAALAARRASAQAASQLRLQEGRAKLLADARLVHKLTADLAVLDASRAQAMAALNTAGDAEALERELIQRRDDAEASAARVNVARGQLESVRAAAARARALVEQPALRGAAAAHRSAAIGLRTLELVVDDLQAYGRALERALVAHHTERMEEINASIADTWARTYRGTDIEGIRIEAEAEGAAAAVSAAAAEGTAARQRQYNYRVVMKVHGAELDMRGRCSAGQRVLASLVIRLALAEAFGMKCGMLALDEPTTNLDHANAMSLAESLRALMNARKGTRGFQLIVITHDEDFAHQVGTRELADQLYRLDRFGTGGNEGCSRIRSEQI